MKSVQGNEKKTLKEEIAVVGSTEAKKRVKKSDAEAAPVPSKRKTPAKTSDLKTTNVEKTAASVESVDLKSAKNAPAKPKGETPAAKKISKPKSVKPKQEPAAKPILSRKTDPASIKVLFASSEATPFIKTGGLADVAGTLPLALKRSGIDVRVILPKYNDISDHWKERMKHLTHIYVQMGWRRQYCGVQYIEFDGVTFYFIDNEFYFARDSVYVSGHEEGERFGFFCRAVLSLLPHLDFFPDIIHCNDWQTGMIPVLLRAQYMEYPEYSRIRTIFTIHNLKYQGVFSWKSIDDLFNLGPRYYTPDMLEFFGDISFLKAGLVFSDRISTVSPTYAKEIQSPYYGERLDGLLRSRSGQLSGILNGIDYIVWDPATDYLLDNHYSVDDMKGKALCKAALQRELGLPEREDAMIVAMVTRLTEQKGLSLIERVLNEIMQLPIQLVVVGQGDQHYCEMLTWAQWRFNDKVAARFEQNEWLAHNVYAGADLFLMPSRFEPCGISQLISLRYGTVPLVRETGGLSDTVQPYNKYTDDGTGFSFANYNAHEMLYTLEQACDFYQDRKLWARLVERGMRMEFDWARSAALYKGIYEDMTAWMRQPQA